MTITASQLKQQSHLLDNVKKEDILITKRNRPYAVIMDIDRYEDYLRFKEKIEKSQEDKIKKRNIEHAFGILASDNVDPVEWQEHIREESDSTLYGKMEQ